MIRAFSAFTSEIDDVDEAVAEILGQLPAEDQFLSQTIALVSCIPEFIESGVLEALQAALPFDLIGQTTTAAASPGSDVLEILNLLIITSDELDFVHGQTEPIAGKDAKVLAEAYHGALGDRTERPAFILMYAPLLLNVGGDFFVNTFDELSGHTPLFGSIAIDNTIGYYKSSVIYRGESSPDRLAFIAIYGDITPRFYQATISHESIFEEKGVVTSSDGNQLMTVDNMTAVEFLKSKGLVAVANGAVEGINSFPYIIDYNDGTPPVIRVIFATTPEGYAVCLGDVPEGSTLSVGHFDEDEIVTTTRQGLERFKDEMGHHVCIVVSCVGRYFTMILDPTGEISATHEFIDPLGVPYILAYSGGEICPMTNIVDGVSLTNRFHNSTFVALTF
ncbi:MAG: FIST C-terminal domain-containing protein [Coriobacteriales bacterium]|jgi:hypothetical protein|nr:FIST C-terminal domain-containing protein [Coriobacteriales bacterium]